MTDVLEARREFDDARTEASEMVARKRAKLGLSMIRARSPHGTESQTTIAAKMGIGVQQVREYEGAYRRWAEQHPGEDPS